ncbi:MBL fold metallo-hydrolase [Kribbella speibonae]|uniref:MBL fold metallo-hydrolase n=1 Tax=Kribbella speibonae TaxID=1572660 RepID=A0A4R0IU03_9ACTN|nr:MBL fold metallo-hydrolase [Kribbella speibonae]
MTLGETKLTYVPDGIGTLKARLWIPEPTDEFWAQHSEYLDEGGHLVTGNGGLLVEHGDRALLVDAGVGPLTMGPPENPFGTLRGGALLDSLGTLGRSPADIEAVAFTHLHVDHVGWAWHPAPDSDQPAFTGAEYLVAEPEWSQRQHAEAQGMGDMLKAMQPQVRTVADGQEIFPGVRVMLIPGHSAGHTAYVISAGGQRVIAFGDAFHSPIQISHPLWEVPADHNAEQAAALRHSLVLELAEPHTIGFGIHFADVPFGRVRVEDGRTVWRPTDA